MVAIDTDINVIKRDRDFAARTNNDAFLKRVKRLSPEALAELLTANFDLFESTINKKTKIGDADHLIDMLRAKDTVLKADAVRQINTALRNTREDWSNALDFKALGVKTIAPEEIARRRIAREVERAGQLKNGRRSLAIAGISTLKALRYGASAPVMLLSGLGKILFVAPANILGATLDFMGVNKMTRVGMLAASMAGVAGMTMMPTDAAPYLPLMGKFQNEFKKACTPQILKSGSVANAFYAVSFKTNGADPRADHAYDTMMAGASHNVPAIALHMISYFETNRFTDMVSNNSTASNPFQLLDSTKLIYLKRYGTQTLQYKDAKERIKSGQTTNNDVFIVNAIDAVRKLSDDNIRQMATDKKFSGNVYDGLRYADTSAMAAELTALDLADKYPEIQDKGISAEKIRDISVQYYLQHHFLGMSTYALLQDMQAHHPKLALTDKKGVTKAYDADVAKTLNRIVTGNPAFLVPGMTAAQGLNAIKTNFTKMVEKPFNSFASVYKPDQSTISVCLIDPNHAKTVPETIPNYKAMGLLGSAAYEAFTPGFVKDGIQYTSDNLKTMVNGKAIFNSNSSVFDKDIVVQPTNRGPSDLKPARTAKIPIPAPSPLS